MKYTREIENEVLSNFYRHHDKCFNDGEIKDYLDTKYPQLPEKGWLKSQHGAIVYRTGEKSGYGIDLIGEWDKSEDCSFVVRPTYWRQATREEVEEALFNFARKQGYKNGNYKCLSTSCGTFEVKENVFHMDDEFFDVWHGEEDGEHNLVFNSFTGEWAKIIEDENKELKEQIEKVEKQLNELK